MIEDDQDTNGHRFSARTALRAGEIADPNAVDPAVQAMEREERQTRGDAAPEEVITAGKSPTVEDRYSLTGGAGRHTSRLEQHVPDAVDEVPAGEYRQALKHEAAHDRTRNGKMGRLSSSHGRHHHQRGG